MLAKHLFAFIGSLIAILAIGGALALFRSGALAGLSPQEKRETVATGTIDSSASVSVGPKNASVTVVEFLDFQCPFCRAVHPTLMRIMQDYADQPIRFVFRHFPLVSIHPFALPSANASLCANEQNKFLEYYNLLYTRQDEISSTSLVTFAQELGLNLEQFNACTGEKRYESSIRQDVRDGLDLGIEGTPTWYVNDIQLVGAIEYETLKRAIESERTKRR